MVAVIIINNLIMEGTSETATAAEKLKERMDRLKKLHLLRTAGKFCFCKLYDAKYYKRI